MKMMHGACALPCSNRSRTREAPTPTNISTKSDPDIEKNGRPASPATALASSVFPVPGGPISSAPLGSRPPNRWNFWGSFRKSMISSSSCFASSQPATSAKVILGVSPESSFALDFPKAKARCPPASAAPKPKAPAASGRSWPGGGGGGESARDSASGQTRYIRKVPEVFGVIEPVPDQKRPGGVETDERRFQLQWRSNVLVQQGTDLQTLRAAHPQQRHQPVEGLPGIDDILDQEDVFPLELRFRVVQQPDVPAGDGLGAVARGDQKVDLQR